MLRLAADLLRRLGLRFLSYEAPKHGFVLRTPAMLRTFAIRPIGLLAHVLAGR